MTTSARPNALRVTLRDPLYRGATIALFLSGLGFSAAAPLIATFLVDELGASYATAGLFYLTNLTAPIAGFLVGSRSDRTGSRLGLFRLCAVLGGIGWALIALAPALWIPFVVSAVVLGFAGAAGSQLFAAIHDRATQDPAAPADGVVAIVRMSLTAGWVIGPMLGAFLAAAAGSRAALLATAVCTVAQIVPLGLQCDTAAPVAHEDDEAAGNAGGSRRSPGLRAMTPLLVFTALYVLVYAGESIKYAYLPLYMKNILQLDPLISGSVIGIQPFVEIILMPLAVITARRTGTFPLLVLAALFGVGANVLFAVSQGPVELFAGQILMGGVWGIFAALGIIVAQRLLPGAVATASAIFMSSTALSSAIGGVSGGLGSQALGLPHVFVIPAAMGLLAAVGLIIMGRRARGTEADGVLR